MSIVPLYVPINEIDKYFYNRTEDIKKIEYYLNSLEMGILLEKLFYSKNLNRTQKRIS